MREKILEHWKKPKTGRRFLTAILLWEHAQEHNSRCQSWACSIFFVHLWIFPSNMKQFKQLFWTAGESATCAQLSGSVVCVQEEAWQIQLKIQGLILQQVEQSISSDCWRWKSQSSLKVEMFGLSIYIELWLWLMLWSRVWLAFLSRAA